MTLTEAASALPGLDGSVAMLLIEDDPDHAFLVEQRVAADSRTFTVDHVSDLDGAAARLATTDYDVIVLDLGLPGSDGLSTVERLLELEPSCAIVVMTGATNAVVEARAFALGVNDYLPKSRAATELLPRVLVHAVERESVKQAVAAQVAAEKANRAKSKFLSRISHEFRTPLNAIIGFAQLLEAEATNDDDLEAAGIIVKASEHLLTLIKDVIDLSRAETRELTLSLEAVDLCEVVTDAVDLVTGQFGTDCFDVTFSAGEVPLVHGDRQRISQVVLNLLSNAAKYGPPGGMITVSATGASGAVTVLVNDQGTGITPEEIDRLFEPFERLEQKHSGIDGVGLGLTVSRELLAAMDGEIGATSVDGDGTTFWFKLPVAASH